MKRFLIALAFALVGASCFAQVANKPTIMIKASDSWHHKHNYGQMYNQDGKQRFVPDYEAAFLHDSNGLKTMITTLNGLMKDRGYELQDLESTLKDIQNQAAEEAADDTRSAAKSSLDEVLSRVHCDILLDVTWSVVSEGMLEYVDFQLAAIDSYTNKQVADLQSKSQPTISFELKSALRECLAGGFDAFCNDIMSHFSDMAENGREVSLLVRVDENSDVVLSESEVDGVTLDEFIENWVSENSVNSAYNLSNSTDTRMQFKEIRVPFFNAKGKPLNARDWLRPLRDILKKAGFSKTKADTRGLGRAILYIANE